MRATVRDLLRDLVGSQVVVTEEREQVLSEERTAYMAVYRRDDGSPVAATIVDLLGAAALGGAIGMMSAADVAEELGDATALEGDLYDFFAEVVNVLAKLLNSPTTKHVRLDGIFPVPGEVPGPVAEVVLEPRARVDYTIQVEGHERGVLTLVSI